MKLSRLFIIGVMAAGMPLSLLAVDNQHSDQTSGVKNECHLQQQRSSDFCQRVMFPPVPFR